MAESAVAYFPEMRKTDKSRLLAAETGTQFDTWSIGQSLFGDYRNGAVWDYADQWTARDFETMLERDGKAALLEQVLTLPLRQADWSITPAKGDKGEAEFAKSVLEQPSEAGGMKTPLRLVIGQMTSAQIFRKAFFELVWKLRDGDSKVVYDKIAFRPASTCQLKRDVRTAEKDGFRQAIWQFGGLTNAQRGSKIPGYVDIPAVRSYVHIHGTHRQPLTGLSELQISYWCYETKLKLLFLWYQYLEAQSLPKVIVYGQDQREASAKADDIASMRSSGVVGFQRPPAGAKLFDLIESSGKGADQFSQALDFLESWQTNSVLAGFLDLVRAASRGVGSYALSSDQSSFFMQSREAVATEMAESFTHGVIAPLVAYNYGPDAAYPSLTAGPLEEKGNQDLLQVFSSMAAAPSLNVPAGFLDMITEKLASVLGLDAAEVKTIVTQNAAQRAKAMAAQAPPGMPRQAAAGLGQLHGAVSAATSIARQVTQPGVAEQVTGPARGRHAVAAP